MRASTTKAPYYNVLARSWGSDNHQQVCVCRHLLSQLCHRWQRVGPKKGGWHRLDGINILLFLQIDVIKCYLSAFGMLKEFKTKAFVEMSTLNYSRKICKEYLSIIYELCVTYIRSESGKWVVGYLRECSRYLQLARYVLHKLKSFGV